MKTKQRAEASILHTFFHLDGVRSLTQEGIFADRIHSIGVDARNSTIEVTTARRHLTIASKLLQSIDSRSIPRIVYFSRGAFKWSLFEVAGLTQCPQEHIDSWEKILKLIAQLQDTKGREVREFFGSHVANSSHCSFFVYQNKIQCKVLPELRSVRFLEGVGYFAIRSKEIVFLPIIDLMEANDVSMLFTNEQSWNPIHLDLDLQDTYALSRIVYNHKRQIEFTLFNNQGQSKLIRMTFEDTDSIIPRLVQGIPSINPPRLSTLSI